MREGREDLAYEEEEDEKEGEEEVEEEVEEKGYKEEEKVDWTV